MNLKYEPASEPLHMGLRVLDFVPAVRLFAPWYKSGVGRTTRIPLSSEHGTYKTVKARFWP